jgi:hypothetical protein
LHGDACSGKARSTVHHFRIDGHNRFHAQVIYQRGPPRFELFLGTEPSRSTPAFSRCLGGRAAQPGLLTCWKVGFSMTWRFCKDPSRQAGSASAFRRQAPSAYPSISQNEVLTNGINIWYIPNGFLSLAGEP